MKAKITVLLSLVIWAAACGNNGNSGSAAGNGDENSGVSIAGRAMPACYDINHTKVRFKTTQSTEEGPAFSTLNSSGQPTIYFNERFMQVIAHSESMVMFVYEHECGHHALGHIQMGSMGHDLRQKDHFKQELDADCYSAQKLRSMGYTSSSIVEIIDDVYPWPKDPEHPSGKVRSRHVSACFKSAGE